MRLKVLGSGREVGKSALLVDELMLDFGVKIEPPPPEYPPYEKCAAAVLTHAHLDHSGAVPTLFKKRKLPVVMTDVTLELASLLLRDSMKIARVEGFPIPFGKKHFQAFVSNTRFAAHGGKFKAAGMRCSLHASGHIPGSSSVLVEGKKRVLYTSDVQTVDTRLLRAAQLPRRCDVLVVDSTYGARERPARAAEEKRLLEAVEEAMARNETALFPVFAVGRAQEVLLVLERYADKIALDGMAKTASDIIAEYGRYLRDAEALRRVLGRIHYVKRGSDRAKVAEKFPILISSAGMLGGGPAISYLRAIAHKKESKVLFSGFLVEDSPGRKLLETNIFQNAEEQFHVHCDVKQFELSGHVDRPGIFQIIEHTQPSLVIAVHGDSCEQLAKSIEETTGIHAIAPRNGEEIKL